MATNNKKFKELERRQKIEQMFEESRKQLEIERKELEQKIPQFKIINDNKSFFMKMDGNEKKILEDNEFIEVCKQTLEACKEVLSCEPKNKKQLYYGMMELCTRMFDSYK
jgi:hypothetical protein